MRIRKRTPARAASPGPSPALSASPPRPLPMLQQPPKEDEQVEEKRVILVAGAGDHERDRVLSAASKSSAMDDVPTPEPQDDARCSRNDGKRWRCKNAAVPGFLFCDRHVAWSTRQRQPRPKKQKKNRGGAEENLEKAAAEEDQGWDDASATTPQLGSGDGDDDGFYYYGGFQPGSRKRARDGGPGPAA